MLGWAEWVGEEGGRERRERASEVGLRMSGRGQLGTAYFWSGAALQLCFDHPGEVWLAVFA